MAKSEQRPILVFEPDSDRATTREEYRTQRRWYRFAGRFGADRCPSCGGLRQLPVPKLAYHEVCPLRGCPRRRGHEGGHLIVRDLGPCVDLFHLDREPPPHPLAPDGPVALVFMCVVLLAGAAGVAIAILNLFAVPR